MIRLRGAAAGCLSGLLGALAFPPAGWSWLAFVCLVPLVLHVRHRKGEGTVLPFFLFGVVYFSVGLYWLEPVITPLGPVLLSFVLSFLFYLPMGLVVGALHRRGWPLLALLPVSFLASEWVRTFFFSGFPWLGLAHSQADWLTLIQSAEIWGDRGVTTVLVFGNVAVAEALVLLRPRPRAALVRLAAAVALVGILLAYGALRLPTVKETPGPTVLVVQGNIPQYMKSEALDGANPQLRSARFIFDVYVEGTRYGVARHPESQVVIWPETMFPYWLSDVPGPEADTRRKGVERAFEIMTEAANGRPLIVGGHYRTAAGRPQNAAFHLDDRGLLAGRYAKVHAVPGGEYIPFRAIAPTGLVEWVKDLIKAQAGFRPEIVEGKEPVLFEVGGYRYAPLICYEICYPQLVRDVRERGADVLLNITNYGWFPGTHEPEQANQMAVFRAIEARAPVVVAANTGISAVISPRGRVKEIDVRGTGKEVRGVLSARVPIAGDGPPMPNLADIFSVLAALALLTGLLWRPISRILGRWPKDRS